jgi:hypothetical protein
MGNGVPGAELKSGLAASRPESDMEPTRPRLPKLSKMDVYTGGCGERRMSPVLIDATRAMGSSRCG